MKAVRADIGLAACIIVFAAIYLYADGQLPSAHIGDPLGPKAFPALLAGGLLISGLLLINETWRKRRSETPGAEAESQPVNKKQLLILACMVAWTALYYVAFEHLGYILSTPVFLFGLLSHFHRGHLLANLLIAACFTGIVFALFSLLLGVPLPSGPLPI